MLPLVFFVVPFVSAAVVKSLNPDSRIERNLNKAFNPNLPPGERQKAYNTAMRINENRYKGEDFTDIEYEEKEYQRWVEQQKLNQVEQRPKRIQQYANNARLDLKGQLDNQSISLEEYEEKMRQVTNWQRKMEEM